ncbi:MAG: hypothetical protein IKK99_03795 [Oscillospiraceae bacterium]|nr:hypothetical protein [Oscillospiraceae bacterium]
MKRNYDDIINLSRHISDKHPHLSVHDRAAQFAPFAALTGHSEAVSETARYVDQKIDLGEDAIKDIQDALNYIQEHIAESPQVTIIYFVADGRKQGGRYITESSTVKVINDLEQTVYLNSGVTVKYDNVYEINIS